MRRNPLFHAEAERMADLYSAEGLSEGSRRVSAPRRLASKAAQTGRSLAFVGWWPRTGRKPVAKLFHADLVAKTQNFQTIRWMGIEMRQNVLDLWTIQETITEVRPALLIETGTWDGGSALFYAQLMDLLGEGRVLTIDIDDKNELDHPRMEFLHGSSTAPGDDREGRERRPRRPTGR